MSAGAEQGIAGFAARLRVARAAKNLSLVELCERAGVSRRTVGPLEAGDPDARPGLLTVEQLAMALELSPGWLAFGEGPAPTRRAEEPEVAPAPVVWPWSHRLAGYDSPALPPLAPRFAPVVEALGPWLPYRRRAEVAAWLAILTEKDHELQGRCTKFMGSLLRKAVPTQHHEVVKEVMRQLRSRSWTQRARMALVLLVDAGLPVWDLHLPCWGDPPRELEELRTAARDILYVSKHGDPRPPEARSSLKALGAGPGA